MEFVIFMTILLIALFSINQWFKTKRKTSKFFRFMKASKEIKQHPERAKIIINKYGFSNKGFLLYSIKVRSAVLVIKEKRMKRNKPRKRKIKLDKTIMKLVRRNYKQVIKILENKN